jgi:large subunit ribosomal protein L6
MSRIGKQPVQIPEKVNISISGKSLSVKGPLGEEKIELMDGISINIEGNILNVVLSVAEDEIKEKTKFHGLIRSLINNMVIGVSAGFEKELEIVGVGYRAAQQGKDIQFQLGFSHNIIFKAPEGITLVVIDPTKLKILGKSKYLVGQTAANIRKLREPEPYKGKGIKYKGEKIRRKAGKTGK